MSVDKLIQIITPEQFRHLADWIDVKVPNDPDPEVQESLRRFADELETMSQIGSVGRRSGEVKRQQASIRAAYNNLLDLEIISQK